MSEMSRMQKAVALKYPPGFEAPVIVSKAFGKHAEMMIEQAQKQNVNVVENSMLVDMLGLCGENSIVPEETWEVLAQIFSVLLKDGDYGDSFNKKDWE